MKFYVADGMKSYKIDDFHGHSEAYFLTHVHTDHLSGLCDGWRRGFLYTSPQSLRVLRCMFDGLEAYTRVLDQDHPQIVDLGFSLLEPPLYAELDNVSRFPGDNVQVTVRTIDANHCPGSVMLHVSGDFGSRLHTGDFRYDREEHSVLAHHEFSNISELFLDTTFMHPSWIMPTKERSIHLIFQLIDTCGRHGDVRFLSDCYGQEDILIAVHRRYGQKIILDMQRPDLLPRKTISVWMSWLFCIDSMKNVVTNDMSCPSRFWVGPRGGRRRHRPRACAIHAPPPHLPSAAAGADDSKEPKDEGAQATTATSAENNDLTAHDGQREKTGLVIRASTLYFGCKHTPPPSSDTVDPSAAVPLIVRTKHRDVVQCKRSGVWHVLYSMHSSYAELATLLAELRPQRVFCGLPGVPNLQLRASDIPTLDCVLEPTAGAVVSPVKKKAKAAAHAEKRHDRRREFGKIGRSVLTAETDAAQTEADHKLSDCKQLAMTAEARPSISVSQPVVDAASPSSVDDKAGQVADLLQTRPDAQGDQSVAGTDEEGCQQPAEAEAEEDGDDVVVLLVEGAGDADGDQDACIDLCTSASSSDEDDEVVEAHTYQTSKVSSQPPLRRSYTTSFASVICPAQKHCEAEDPPQVEEEGEEEDNAKVEELRENDVEEVVDEDDECSARHFFLSYGLAVPEPI